MPVLVVDDLLQHAREATRCIRVEVVKARGLRVADARRLNQADHHTFIGGGGGSEMLCFRTVR